MIEPRPEAILLDAGNTLVFVDGVRTHEIVMRHGGSDSAERFAEVEREARLRLSTNLAHATGHEDQVWRDYFVHLFTTMGVPAERVPEAGAMLKAEHAREHLWTHVDPATPAALERLVDLGYRLGVISNADGRVPALLESVGLARHFEFIIDSELVGVSKPDPRIFAMGVERMGVPPASCLYVGDLYAIDVVGARGAGLEALLLDPFGELDYDVPRLRSVAELPDWLGPRSGASTG